MRDMQKTTCRPDIAHCIFGGGPWMWAENSFTFLNVFKSQKKNSISWYVKIVWNANFIIHK